jgi:hypothetical protein
MTSENVRVVTRCLLIATPLLNVCSELRLHLLANGNQGLAETRRQLRSPRVFRQTSMEFSKISTATGCRATSQDSKEPHARGLQGNQQHKVDAFLGRPLANRSQQLTSGDQGLEGESLQRVVGTELPGRINQPQGLDAAGQIAGGQQGEPEDGSP